MPHNKSVFQIVKWLDDKNRTLHQCFNKPKENGYAHRQAFLRDLQLHADLLSKSELNQNAWNKNGHINIARCMKGLKGLDATSDAVKSLLQAVTDKLNLLQVKLDGRGQ